MIRTKGGGNTDVIQIHNLIVADFGVLYFSGDNKLVASGYRNLQKEVKTQQRKENRQSDWARYLEGRERETGRTSIPSLIRPVLISGPFCHAGISIDSRQNHDSEVCNKWNGTNRIEGNGNGTSFGVSCGANEPVQISSPNRRTDPKKRGTSSHFTSVIYNALVVLVRSMGKVHANWLTSQTTKIRHRGIDIGIGRTDVDTSPPKLSELLRSVDLGP